MKPDRFLVTRDNVRAAPPLENNSLQCFAFIEYKINCALCLNEIDKTVLDTSLSMILSLVYALRNSQSTTVIISGDTVSPSANLMT